MCTRTHARQRDRSHYRERDAINYLTLCLSLSLLQTNTHTYTLSVSKGKRGRMVIVMFYYFHDKQRDTNTNAFKVVVSLFRRVAIRQRSPHSLSSCNSIVKSILSIVEREREKERERGWLHVCLKRRDFLSNGFFLTLSYQLNKNDRTRRTYSPHTLPRLHLHTYTYTITYCKSFTLLIFIHISTLFRQCVQNF